MASTRTTMAQLLKVTRAARSLPGFRIGARRAMSAAPEVPAPPAGIDGSQYEDYDSSAKTYDRFRQHVGMGVLRGALDGVAGRMGKAAGDLRLLDCGCGSGTYLEALKPYVGEVRGLEFNGGMIAKATEKLGDGVVTQGSVCENPFKSASFDACITTQVVHHLDPEDGEPGYPNVALALNEAFRVTRPGGCYAINTTSPRQHVDGFWWAPIVPDAIANAASRMPPLEFLEEALRAAGYETVERHVPPEALMPDDLYLNIEGPLDELYRRADSSWTLAADEELEKGLASHRARLADGTARAWLEEREALRAAVGQTTTLIAVKG